MTYALVLDADRYKERVRGTPLETETQQWMRRIAAAAHDAGGEIEADGETCVLQARWDGEGYQIQLLHRDIPADRRGLEDITFWWTPPEPPPPALMAHALPQLADTCPSCGEPSGTALLCDPCAFQAALRP